MVISVLNIYLDKSRDISGWNLFNYVKTTKDVLHFMTSK